jgi:nicotinate-nucleotide adenylyltransferase
VSAADAELRSRRPAPEPAPPGARRVGILGGTFDPPHLGHLALAEEAREALGLERVVFVPAGRPWQKADRAVTPAEIRVEMVERATTGNPAFVVDRREVDRPGPTYTVDTLVELAAAAPVGTEHWLILSAEALAGLRTWRDPEGVLRLARLCVAPRGVDLDAAGPVADLLAAVPAAADRIVVLDGPRLAISSTAIRDRVAAGRSIRYLVPDGVIEVVTRYALYRPDGAVSAPAPDA